jgi:hypothetical protein
MHDFVITSKPNHSLRKLGLELIFDRSGLQLWGEKEEFKRINDLVIYIRGYVLPRHSILQSVKGCSEIELIARLFNEHGQDFIHYLKGSFIILLIANDEIKLYNDYQSLEKFFLLRTSKELIISNNVLLINKLHKLELNPLYPAIQALFQHSVAGITLFEDLQYSEYATILRLDHEAKLEKYWTPHHLINNNRDLYSIEDLIVFFREIIHDYLLFLKPLKVSLTLTGGRDTRSVLAALLSLNVVPHSFTFGNPKGTDVNTAWNICSSLELPFSNHYIGELTKNLYDNLVFDILKFGNPLVNLHRAHRMDAIKKEHSESGQIEMLFVGAMGGDFIKGVSFNDYIVTEFMRLYMFSNKDAESLIKEVLSKHNVKFDDELIYKLIGIINSLEYLDRHNFKKSEFLMAHNFIGALHDTQDLFIFSQYADRVVAPFMDIDFFEALFQSRFSLFDNYRSSVNPVLKLKGGEFQASLINSLYKPLAYLPMANRYKPIDLLENQYLYFLKRVYLKIRHPKTKPTFSYDTWFKDFIEAAFSTETDWLERFYDLEQLICGLNGTNHQTTEGYWHRYSNPVMVLRWINLIKSNFYAGSDIAK